jgi:hypothetical protein
MAGATSPAPPPPQEVTRPPSLLPSSDPPVMAPAVPSAATPPRAMQSGVAFKRASDCTPEEAGQQVEAWAKRRLQQIRDARDRWNDNESLGSGSAATVSASPSPSPLQTRGYSGGDPWGQPGGRTSTGSGGGYYAGYTACDSGTIVNTEASLPPSKLFRQMPSVRYLSPAPLVKDTGWAPWWLPTWITELYICMLCCAADSRRHP